MENRPPRARPTRPTATARPKVSCTVRETSSGAGAAPASRACWSSKAIACPTCGSPKIHAKTRARAPAASPASIPRTSSVLISMWRRTPRSVAGEAEQVTAVVHELVHVVPTDQGRRALFGADEVDHKQAENGGEHGPRKDLPQRDADRNGPGPGDGHGCLGHVGSSFGISASRRWGRDSRGPG